MRDIEKMNMAHGSSSRRIRRRRRGRSLYALLVVILTFAIVVVLSMTVFFNIRIIRVTGNAEYSPEYIVETLGISEGDNMMRLSLPELETKGEELLLNAETVTIRRQFPSTLVIDVQQAVPAYNVSYEYGTLIVSQKNKILQNSMDPMSGLVNIIGYVPEETTPGRRLSAVEERHDKILSAFQDLMQENNLAVPIVSVNMTDLNDIIVNFDSRIEFDMGNWSEINYKISFAEQVIAEQSADKEGYLTMIGTNQCSFRNKADVLNAEKNAERRAVAQQEADALAASETSENPEEIPENPEQNAVMPETIPEIPEQLE